MTRIGFIGLGVMGMPMAHNLIKCGNALLVWNRSTDKSNQLENLGVTVAPEPKTVFQQCEVVILMMADEISMDLVLSRGTDQFDANVANCKIVIMGTFSAQYAKKLSVDIDYP